MASNVLSRPPLGTTVSTNVRKIPRDRSSANPAFVSGHRATVSLAKRKSRSFVAALSHPDGYFCCSCCCPGFWSCWPPWLCWPPWSGLLMCFLDWLVFTQLVNRWPNAQVPFGRNYRCLRSVQPSWNTDYKGRRVDYPGSPLQKLDGYLVAHVRLWPKADISQCIAHVRFRG